MPFRDLVHMLTSLLLKTGGLRSGELSLRQQRMTQPMLEALRTETARVQMSLVRYVHDTAMPVPVDPSGSKYLPPPNEFVYLRTKVTNLSRKHQPYRLFRAILN